MKSVVEVLTEHRSDRSFLETPIADDILNKIIMSAYHAPTSVNSQQVSVILVQDKEHKQKIAALAGGQPWIARAPAFLIFVLDMYKSAQGMAAVGKEQIAHQSVESLIAGATDVGIALGSALVAARSEGLGGVPIGGIRMNPQQMIEILDLPEMTFPVAGISIGYVDQPSHVKPRLPVETFVHHEKYRTQGLTENINQYNQQLTQHWQNIGRTEGESWSESVSGYYQKIYFPQVAPALKQQGFGTDK